MANATFGASNFTVQSEYRGHPLRMSFKIKFGWLNTLPMQMSQYAFSPYRMSSSSQPLQYSHTFNHFLTLRYFVSYLSRTITHGSVLILNAEKDMIPIIDRTPHFPRDQMCKIHFLCDLINQFSHALTPFSTLCHRLPVCTC